MKRFADLTTVEQHRALHLSIEQILEKITVGVIKFGEDDLQRKVDQAIAKAEENRTPWFAPLMVYEAAPLEIDALALADVEDAFYPEVTDTVLFLHGEMNAEFCRS